MAGIHDTTSSNCIVPAIVADLSKTANNTIEITRGARVKMAAIYLISREESLGVKAIMMAPTTGRRIMVVR